MIKWKELNEEEKLSLKKYLHLYIVPDFAWYDKIEGESAVLVRCAFGPETKYYELPYFLDGGVN